MLHELKTNHEYFLEAVQGKKTFTVRKADRPFKVNDTIRKLDVSTGQFAEFKITYILKGGQYGISEDYVVMGLQKLNMEHYKIHLCHRLKNQLKLANTKGKLSFQDYGFGYNSDKLYWNVSVQDFNYELFVDFNCIEQTFKLKNLNDAAITALKLTQADTLGLFQK